MNLYCKAVRANQVENVRKLLEAKGDPNELDDGSTLLARAKSAEVVRVLMDAKANIEEIGGTDYPALFFHAEKSGRHELIAALAQKGTKLEFRPEGFNG